MKIIRSKILPRSLADLRAEQDISIPLFPMLTSELKNKDKTRIYIIFPRSTMKYAKGGQAFLAYCSLSLDESHYDFRIMIFFHYNYHEISYPADSPHAFDFFFVQNFDLSASFHIHFTSWIT